ncbi:hypothetical protein SAMN05421743_102222 [Thalassobacillus cyri]|uniref:Uncharacterized protein n=1 Tax=Thalassobacillus cyri TaxID=571932 RepID=A0A1H3XRX4_9BACI|nr:hypothetical protein [Thalassobacillus cyri]SEA01651.1 hypothetical protein SAMN05421743_102222 [Thalassobacillus cyri]
MRTRPLLYVCLMVLAVFFLPADTFANIGNTPEQASPHADVEIESSNPVAEETSEKGEETSQAVKEQAAEKGSQASETAEEASNHGKQISQETTGKNIQLNKESEPAEPVKDKTSTLPPQASDKASELTNELKRKADSKKAADKKQVEDKPQDEKGRSKRSVEKSSGKGEEQPAKTDKHNNSSADDQADKKEDLQPVGAEAESTSERVDTSAADSGEANTQKNSTAINQQPKKQEQEEPAPLPEPSKDPIAQIHMTKPASFPSPVSSSGGDFGGQTTFSLIKGNLPGSFQFVASNSQTIGKRSEFLTDQWVNAPPAEPPKAAS